MKLIQTAIEIIMLRAPARERYSEWPLSHSVVILLGIALGYYYVTPPLFENQIFNLTFIATIFVGTMCALVLTLRHYSHTEHTEKFSVTESINILAAATLIWSIVDIFSQWYYGYMMTIVNSWLVAVYVLAAAYMFYTYYKALKIATNTSHRRVVLAIGLGIVASMLVTACVVGIVSAISEITGTRFISPLCTLQTLPGGAVVDSCDGTVHSGLVIPTEAI